MVHLNPTRHPVRCVDNFRQLCRPTCAAPSALTGTEGLIGVTGVVKESFRAGEIGSVFVQGEWWNVCIANGEVVANTPIRVLNRQGMILTVTPTNTESIRSDGSSVAAAGPVGPTTDAQLTQSNENT